MDIVDKLKNKNIKVKEIPKWGAYLRKEWEKNFANHLNDKEKKPFIYLIMAVIVAIYGIFSVMKRKIVLKEKKLKGLLTMNRKINVMSSSKIQITHYSLRMLQRLTPTT